MSQQINSKLLIFFAAGLIGGVVYIGISLLIAEAHAASPNFRWFGLDYMGSAFATQAILQMALLGAAGLIQLRERRATSLVWLTVLSTTGMAAYYFVVVGRYVMQHVSFEGEFSVRSAFFGTASYGSITPYLPALWYLVFSLGAGFATLRIARWRSTVEHEKSDVHGRSRFLESKDFKELGMYSDLGSIVGRCGKTHRRLYLEFSQRLIIAPSGAGKDRGVLIPALLSQDRGAVAFDPKAEMYFVAAPHRARMGGRRRTIYAVDPFGVLDIAHLKRAEYDSVRATSNALVDPLIFVRSGTNNLMRDINAVVTALVTRAAKGGAGKSDHFEDWAEILLRGFIWTAFFMWERDGRASGRPTLPDIETIAQFDADDLDSFMAEMVAAGGPAESAANRLKTTAKEEWGSILSTTYRQVQWISDPNVRRVLSGNTIDFDAVAKGDADIFIVVPEDQIPTHRKLVALIFQTIRTQLQQRPVDSKPERDIWFLINEAGLLGFSRVYQESWVIDRASGIVAWMVFQTIDQLDDYPHASQFLSAAVKHLFGSDDPKSLKMAVDWCGKVTEENVSHTTGESVTGGSRQSVSGSKSLQVSSVGVELLRTEDFRTMNASEQIVLARGKHPIRCKLARYDEDKELSAVASGNPVLLSRQKALARP